MSSSIAESIVIILSLLTCLYVVFIGVIMCIKLNRWIDDTAHLISDEIDARLNKNTDE